MPKFSRPLALVRLLFWERCQAVVTVRRGDENGFSYAIHTYLSFHDDTWAPGIHSGARGP